MNKMPKLNYNNTISMQQSILMYRRLLDIGRIKEGGAAHERMLHLERVLELKYAVNSTMLTADMKLEAKRQLNELVYRNDIYQR